MFEKEKFKFESINNLPWPREPIAHDGLIKISIGASRLEKNWQRLEVSWQEFLQRLAATTYTAETQDEFSSFAKDKQDKIKDVGGFVGGVLRSGRRQAQNVINRHLVTLDADFAPFGLWEKFTSLYKNAAAIYSTHKHSSARPRFRLIIPLASPVGPDAYIAISRYIAGSLGMEYFDDTTFQPERLMFWPSTSRNADYYFKYQDHAWLDPSDILSKYEDWTDSSTWPGAAKGAKLVVDKIKKQGDPLKKPGLIGEFCRAYSIHAAIERFLSDIYAATDLAGRYTYLKGSASCGLITYEDKYAYSHHATDPAAIRLCNAFDLVRLHKFGTMDKEAHPGTPINRLPSYQAMVKLAQKTTKMQTKCRLRAEASLTPSIVKDEWLKQLEVDAKGRYVSSSENIRLVLENDPALKNAFAFNEFTQRPLVLKKLPWREPKTLPCGLKDIDEAGLRVHLEKHYGIQSMLKTRDGLSLSIIQNSFHPVKDYLQSLQWDQVSRLDGLLIDYLGAEDSEYTRAVTRKSLVAAVARIFEPGIKFDNVLVVVGKQGVGKSTLINKLGQKWYSDSFLSVQGKEAVEQLQGVWLMEIGELAALRRAEMESIKLFISKQEDIYRPAYGRQVEHFPRQCVFFGTTNNEGFLRDPTGNRRFWPVQVSEQAKKNVFQDLNKQLIDQVWAEALVVYRQGEKLFLEGESLRQEAKSKQTEHAQVDERAGIIERYLETLLPEKWDSLDIFNRRSFIQGEGLLPKGTIRRQRACVAEIWCELFGRQQGDMTSYNTKELHNIMRNMENWELYKEGKVQARFKLYGKQKCYVRRTSEVLGHDI